MESNRHYGFAVRLVGSLCGPPRLYRLRTTQRLVTGVYRVLSSVYPSASCLLPRRSPKNICGSLETFNERRLETASHGSCACVFRTVVCAHAHGRNTVSHDTPENVEGYHGSRKNIQCELCDHNGNLYYRRQTRCIRQTGASYGSAT